MSILGLNRVLPMPTGIDRLGFPTYGALPGNVPNPPHAWAEAQELAVVRELNARTHASPQAIRFTEQMAESGGLQMWTDFAGQYRRAAGFARGWVGTGLMYAAMGAATLRTQLAKRSYQRLRPFQIDQSIRPIGKLPHDPGYPSGHTSAAYAAATTLAQLWPARAHEFMWWARQVGLSRVHGGVHFPSDVEMGANVGMRAGLAATSLVR
jgi:membrane-associated phospholipid phosphatase